MQEKDLNHSKNHIINIKNREEFTATDVINIEYFTPEAVAAKTSCGRLIIKGKNLFVDTLESKSGSLLIKGTVNELVYENTGENKSALKKLFR